MSLSGSVEMYRKSHLSTPQVMSGVCGKDVTSLTNTDPGPSIHELSTCENH